MMYVEVTVMRNENQKEEERVKPEVFIQYRTYESNIENIEARIREDYFRKEVAPIESMQIYLKVEDSAAYYVINDSAAGVVSLFV